MLIHVTGEFFSIKLICRNLYALFSHVRKADTANQNGIRDVSHVSLLKKDFSFKEQAERD